MVRCPPNRVNSKLLPAHRVSRATPTSIWFLNSFNPSHLCHRCSTCCGWSSIISPERVAKPRRTTEKCGELRRSAENCGEVRRTAENGRERLRGFIHQQLQQRPSAPIRSAPQFSAAPSLSLRGRRCSRMRRLCGAIVSRATQVRMESAEWKVERTPPPQSRVCFFGRRAEPGASHGASSRPVRQFPPNPRRPGQSTLTRRTGATALAPMSETVARPLREDDREHDIRRVDAPIVVAALRHDDRRGMRAE